MSDACETCGNVDPCDCPPPGMMSMTVPSDGLRDNPVVAELRTLRSKTESMKQTILSLVDNRNKRAEAAEHKLATVRTAMSAVQELMNGCRLLLEGGVPVTARDLIWSAFHNPAIAAMFAAMEEQAAREALRDNNPLRYHGDTITTAGNSEGI